MTKENKKAIVFKIVTIIILSASIVPIIVMGLYSRPCVDDFGYSLDTHRLIQSGNWNVIELIKTALKVDWFYYNTWQGLYTSAFLLALQPGILGEKYYVLGPLLLLTLSFISLYSFIRTLNSYFIKSKRNSLVVALLIWVAIWQGVPNITEGLYWFNGAWNYTPYIFLILINCALVITYYFEKNNKGLASIICATVISFLISGGNHVTSFLNLMVLFLCMIIMMKNRNKGIFSPFTSAVIGFIVMFKAPGTAVRMGAFQRPGIFETIISSGIQLLKYLSEWVNIRWLAFVVIIVFYSLLIVKSNEVKLVRIHPVFVAGISLFFLGGMLCIPYYAMGNFGAGRLTNVVWITFIILSVIVSFYSVYWIESKFGKTESFDANKYIYILMIIFVLILCFDVSSNVRIIYEEIDNGIAAEYAAQYDQRIDLMESNSQNIFLVEELPDSYILKLDDITSDQQNWVNIMWKDYYGTEMIAKPQIESIDELVKFVQGLSQNNIKVLIEINNPSRITNQLCRNICNSEIDMDNGNNIDMIAMCENKASLIEKFHVSGSTEQTVLGEMAYFDDGVNNYGIYIDGKECFTETFETSEKADIRVILLNDDLSQRISIMNIQVIQLYVEYK